MDAPDRSWMHTDGYKPQRISVPKHRTDLLPCRQSEGVAAGRRLSGNHSAGLTCEPLRRGGSCRGCGERRIHPLLG